ncbi:hypothetical protein TRIUR3_27015 [Triticum urartu]|uniref:Metallo-beta-lactamase domain-containing protein n=1 Tax=Triticum urartu TaxID=4572 RepID=M7YF67_TRIUA|nr:hypothetical protein TRIUR3_27015 [Triticum urartu]
MALSLRAAASLAAPPAHLRPRRRATSMVRATVSPPPALDSRRRPQNVSGEFFVDHRCIDCATCRWMAPEVFKRVDDQSAVAAQPTSEEIRTKALQALLSCPTGSIHTDKPTEDILQVQNTFPLPINDDLPGVYLCGYHSENSYGATSYLIVHPEGNIMVDRFSDNLFCSQPKVEDITADAEWKLTGNGPWNIGTDFELIHTPGHTEGSVCLLYKPLKALFTGDHVAKSEESDDLNLFLMYMGVQLDSIRKLLDVDFEWFLPGHGYRIRYADVYAKNSAIEALLADYRN